MSVLQVLNRFSNVEVKPLSREFSSCILRFFGDGWTRADWELSTFSQATFSFPNELLISSEEF